MQSENLNPQEEFLSGTLRNEAISRKTRRLLFFQTYFAFVVELKIRGGDRSWKSFYFLWVLVILEIRLVFAS